MPRLPFPPSPPAEQLELEIRLYQMPSREIGLLTSLVEAYEGIGNVRTLDQGRGIVECWVAPSSADAFDGIIASMRRRFTVVALSRGELE